MKNQLELGGVKITCLKAKPLHLSRRQNDNTEANNHNKPKIGF